MKKFRFLAAIAVVSTFFYACQEKDLATDLKTEPISTKSPAVYLENDYLVFKSIASIDSVTDLLNKQGEASQLAWEQSLGFTSAKAYRSQASDGLQKFTTEAEAKPYIQELVNKGYFSTQDSSLTYPFKMIIWDAVLNPQGLVKIDSVLYCFQKNAQICALDGKKETLNSYLQGHIDANNSLISVVNYAVQKTYGVTFGSSLASVVRTSGSYKLTIQLIYTATYQTGSTTIADHVYYKLYYHQQKYSIAWWNDSQTIYHYYPTSLQIGGTNGGCDPELWPNPVYGPTATWYTVNTTSLANVYDPIWESDIYPSAYSGGYAGPMVQMNYTFYSDNVSSSSDTNPVKIVLTY